MKKNKVWSDLSFQELRQLRLIASNLYKQDRTKFNKNKKDSANNEENKAYHRKQTGKIIGVNFEDYYDKAWNIYIANKNKIVDKNFLKGRIYSLSNKGGKLKTSNGEIIDFYLNSYLAFEQKTVVAVGDWVYYTISDQSSKAFVEQIDERTQILSRPDPTDPRVERVIAVNMDVVAIVVSLLKPKINFRLIDRFLIMAQQTTAKIVLVVNKLDLAKDNFEEISNQLKIYQDVGVQVIFTSVIKNKGLDELMNIFQQNMVAVLGASGVGKSSLINFLDGKESLAVIGGIREKYGKGSHTTVMAEIYDLEREGISIIDTPGIRTLSFIEISPEELTWYFPEFIDYITCRFSDCSHSHEDSCGIKAAVKVGKINQKRYDSYIRILQDIDLSLINRYAKRNYTISKEEEEL